MQKGGSIKNEAKDKPTPVWLSLAIIKWAGAVTDAIDGMLMDVDYVRVYQKEAAGQKYAEPFFPRNTPAY